MPIVKPADDRSASIALDNGNRRHFQVTELDDAEIIVGNADLIALDGGRVYVYKHEEGGRPLYVQLAKDRHSLGVGDLFTAAAEEFGMHADAKHLVGPAIHHFADQS